MSFFQQNSGPEAGAFWKSLEETLGTPVLAYGLGQYISGRDVPGPKWGLVYLTETTLYFRHFAQQNWLTGLMHSGDSGALGSGPGGAGGAVLLEVPLAGMDLRGADARRRSILSRFLGSSRNEYSLADRHGTERPFVFSIEQTDSQVIPELTRLLGGHLLGAR